MQKSPCLECDLKDQDKKNPTCGACQVRKDYVKFLGGPSESVPVEMTDMRSKKTMTDIRSKKTQTKWDQAKVDFLRAKVDTMTNQQLADHLGVTRNQISNQLSWRKIKRNGDFKRGVVFREMEPDSKDLLHAKETPPPGASKSYFIIDFSQHGDLYDRFLSFSKVNFRTAENQILYLIHQALQADGN